MLVGSNGAKHTLRIPVHTIYVGRAGNTNWGVGKQDREGKAANKAGRYQILWVTRTLIAQGNPVIKHSPQGYPNEVQGRGLSIYIPTPLSPWLRAAGRKVEEGCSFFYTPAFAPSGQEMVLNQWLNVL